MAALPDPSDALTGDDLAAYREMAAQRGEPALGQVYVRMFNNPTVARLVGDLGGQLRFHGVLPGDVRELVILHVARRMGVAYEWVHHVGPAHAAGLGAEVLEALAAGRVPGALRADQRAALVAADAVFDLSSIPPEPQGTLAAAHGTAAVVELAALVGHYRLIGGMVTAFDIAIESELAPFVPAWAQEGASS
jgi:4-carboxymuconolactone decarboxylase